MPSTADTFSVRLPDDLKTEIDRLARLSKRSRSFIVKEAVASYVEEQREYLRSIDEALVQAKSGVGHSSEQVFEWMSALGTEHEYPLPEPDIRPDK